MSDHEENDKHYDIDLDDWRPLLEALDASLLAIQASKLRDGVSCNVEIPTDYLEFLDFIWSGHGASNFHFHVKFENDDHWLLRVRVSTNGGDGPDWRQMSTSEVETMRVMRSHGLKVPTAYLPPTCLESPFLDNPYGIDYFFVQFCDGEGWTFPGMPLSLGLLGEFKDDPIHTKKREQVALMIEDYAAFQIQLSEIVFDSIGSLAPSGDSQTVVGPVIDYESNISDTPPYFLRPFATNGDRYLAYVDKILDLIEGGESIEGIEDGSESYIVYSWLRRLVISQGYLFVRYEDHYIKHADDTGDHILAENDRLVAVIDWEWVFVTTKAEAFCGPKFLYEANCDWDDDRYVAGSNELSIEETMLMEVYERLGRPDLADCVRNGRIYHRLYDLIGNPRPHTLVKLNALAKVAYGEGPSAPTTMEEWLERTKVELKDDERLQWFLKELGSQEGSEAPVEVESEESFRASL